MSMTKPLHELSIAEAGRQLRAGTLSSTALTQHALSRIASLDPLLHAFVLVTKERALADAERADREIKSGIDKGPMHGIPYALKDIYATAGIRTTCHSKLLIDNIPAEDCVVEAKFKAGGAVLLGKLATHEFAHRRAELRSAVPAGAQSLEPRPFHRRVVVRLGRGRRRRPGAHRHGLGHWRLDPRAGLLLRHRRAQADLWPGLAARRLSALLHARPLRPAEPGRWRTRPSPCR